MVKHSQERVVFNQISLKVTSSSKMEPLAAKSLIVNLATEHGLVIDSITTDRSSDLKTMMRLGYLLSLYCYISSVPMGGPGLVEALIGGCGVVVIFVCRIIGLSE